MIYKYALYIAHMYIRFFLTSVVRIYVCLQIGISYYILPNTQSLYSEFYLVICNIIYCTENVPIVISDDDIENDFDLSKKVREISPGPSLER